MAVGNDGTLYVSWIYTRGADPPRKEIRIAKSTDGGISFSDPIIVIASSNLFIEKTYGVIRYRSWPTLSTDKIDSNVLYISYLAEQDNDEANVYFVKSTDKGETWSDPIIPVERVTGIQYHPWLSSAPDGTLYLVYGDIPDLDSGLVNIYVALSIDQGETFLRPSVKVNTISSVPSVPGYRGNDYQGIASTFGKAFPCWTDYRSGSEDIYCAIVDIFRSGTLDPGESWSQLVVITGDVRVEQGTELFIDSSTTVYSISDSDDMTGGMDSSRCELIVKGSLKAVGTDTYPVIFKSTGADTSSAGWYGIRLGSGPDTLIFCEVEDAYIGIRSESSTSFISSCSFQNNELAGIGSTPGSDLNIKSSIFEGNGQYGIGLLKSTVAEIVGNEFRGNGDYGIYVTSGDGEGSYIHITGNTIESDSIFGSHDYGIFFRLVDGGEGNAVLLEIEGLNDVSDCLQAGIRVEAPSSLQPLDSLSVVDGNVISNNYNGLEILGGIDLVIQWNEVTFNQNTGIYTSHYYPVLGDNDGGTGGYNSIFGNIEYEIYVVNNTPYNQLKAQMNWWGDSNGLDPMKLCGNILYTPWLTSEP